MTSNSTRKVVSSHHYTHYSLSGTLPNRSSRIPPGVRPWLSRRLEELWGIDGQVYSHYILSVLLDGVDNEFLVENSTEEEPKQKTRSGRKRGQRRSAANSSSLDSDDTTSDESGRECSVDSFENRKRAVVTYLRKHANEDNEVNSLVEELIRQLGHEKESKDSPRRVATRTSSTTEEDIGNSDYPLLGNERRPQGLNRYFNRCASLNSCKDLKGDRRTYHHSFFQVKMGRNKFRRADTGPKTMSQEVPHNRRGRARIASLDGCRSLYLPKLILRKERTSSTGGDRKNEDCCVNRSRVSGPRESSRKRFSSEESGGHSDCPDSSCSGMKRSSSHLIDVSSDYDEEDFFNGFLLDSYDEIDETYNEAFPSLIETHNGHLIAVTTSMYPINVKRESAEESKARTEKFEAAVGASRASLPPNPVSKGQPIWSSKVKAPIGRPMNRKYADAEISNSIIEGANMLLAIDEVVKRSQLSDFNDRKFDPGADSFCSYQSLLGDRDFDSILNMIGLTPEKFPGVREKENPFNFDVSDSLQSFSKCAKDLFKEKTAGIENDKVSDVELKQGLLSPDLSKIWEREGLERKSSNDLGEVGSSLNSNSEPTCDSDENLQARKLSSGTINADPIWMPTEADLGTSLTNTSSTDFRSKNENSLLANVDIPVPETTHHEVCFDLLAGFPGIMLGSENENEDQSSVAKSENSKCQCRNKISSSFCNCDNPDIKYPDIYFSTYDPQLFDLLGFYMLRENIGMPNGGPNDLFSLGNFYRKRDIYFDDYFAEAAPVTFEPRQMSSTDCALPPVLTEHFLMEIMRYNEGISPSTPVGSEFDTGSLFDDKSSEITTLQQRANSLIAKHQRMYQETANVPVRVDAAMQTDLIESPTAATDEGNDANSASPVDNDQELADNVMIERVKDDDFANYIEQQAEQNALAAEGEEYVFDPKLTPWSVGSSSFATETQDAIAMTTHTNTTTASSASDTIAANFKPINDDHFHTFKCPAGCDPNAAASTSKHHQVHEEDLLISPKTHFRPISVQSGDDEDEANDQFEEQLTIEQTFDVFPLPNIVEGPVEIKDSKLFTSWCKGITQPDIVFPDQTVPETAEASGRNSELLRSIWGRPDIPGVPSEQSADLASENTSVGNSLWCPNVDKNASTSDWIESSANHFEAKSSAFDCQQKSTMEDSLDINAYLNMNLNNGAYDANGVEELEFVFDHEMNEQNAYSILNHQHPPSSQNSIFPTEVPVGFIPMETLEDVDCKCMANLPGELGIDPNCQLHGAGAAIYITTGDAHSMSSGGDWSIGSSSSFRALPATTAFNPNMIVGYQGGNFANFSGSLGSNGKKSQMKSNMAANILQLNQSFVSQRQKKRSRSSKSEKDSKCANKPCSYFLEGGCHRSDCKFSHDLGKIPCRFFAEGGCFKNIFCPFKHALPNSIVDTAGELTGSSKNSTETYECEVAAGKLGGGSSDSAEICSAKETSESDNGLQPVELIASLDKVAKTKNSKRRRCKTKNKKNVPNLKDSGEFPILPNEQEGTKEECEQLADAAQLRLNSIYATDGFHNFNDVAVM